MRVRSALGLVVALLLAGCGEQARERAAARSTPTPSPSPTPTVDPGRLTEAEIKALRRADRQLRRAGRAYFRGIGECGRNAENVAGCVAAEYLVYDRALDEAITAIQTAHDAAGRQCRALLENAQAAARKRSRESEELQRAILERRRDDVKAAAGDSSDADRAYEEALDEAFVSCEDLF